MLRAENAALKQLVAELQERVIELSERITTLKKQQSGRKKLLAILAKAPDVQPEEYDRLDNPSS